MDIGTFSAGTTTYAARVANSVAATTVTATASHSEASVPIGPGAEVSLAEGQNTIMVMVAANENLHGDGDTGQTADGVGRRCSPPRHPARGGNLMPAGLW